MVAHQLSASREHEARQKSDGEGLKGSFARQARQFIKETTGSSTRLDCPGDALRCRLNGFCRVVNSFRGFVQWSLGGHSGLP
jgi:hypothetical protein